jgi:hypothetical protein
MPIRDANLDLSPTASDLPLIGANVLSEDTLDLEGTPAKGLALRANLEWSHGSTVAPSLTLYVRAASSTPVSSSDEIVGSKTVLADTQAAQTEVIIPFITSKRYVRCGYETDGAASDSPSWSVVEAFVTENVGREWDRGVNFH